MWFAGLLDALGDWWDGMGPGGHGLVVGAGLGLILLGALLLLPEVAAVAGGLIVTEGGLVVIGGAAAGAGTGGAAVVSILAGTGVLIMAAAGSHAPRGSGTQGSGAPSGGSSSNPPAQWPKVQDPKLQNIVRDLFKGTTNPNRVGDGTTMDAIRNELASGSRTAGKMHLQKGREYVKALTNWLARNPNASATGASLRTCSMS